VKPLESYTGDDEMTYARKRVSQIFETVRPILEAEVLSHSGQANDAERFLLTRSVRAPRPKQAMAWVAL